MNTWLWMGQVRGEREVTFFKVMEIVIHYPYNTVINTTVYPDFLIH